MNIGNRENIPGTKEYETQLSGLYEEYYDKIARYAYVHTGDREEAQDIAGEVFLKALQSLKSYREQGVPMHGWLFRIAHNLTVDYLRKTNKHKRVEIVEVDSLPLLGHDNPVDIAEKSVEFERVVDAMNQLTAEQREVINLRFFGQLTSREVSSVLGKSDGAVREMQRAAIEKLRMIVGADKC
jgi:RNA polymerase sigma-70 factor (ECF subfamily)